MEALDVARTALARGDTRASIAAVDAYVRTFPLGILTPEAQVLRIEAQVKQGDDVNAIAAAKAFLAAQPQSPQARRVKSLIALIEARTKKE
ncbi:MAG: hypothetical protein NVS3B20_21440 [Polyangiales bacterium]